MSASIYCPDCNTHVPESARFCPGCGRPRTHVEEELHKASELTGIPYLELLALAQADDLTRPDESPVQTQRAPVSEPYDLGTLPAHQSTGIVASIAAMSGMGKLILGVALGIGVLIILSGIISVFTGPQSGQASNSRTSGSTSSETRYLNSMTGITTEMSSSMSRFSNLASNPRPFDQSWKSGVASEIVVWDQSYQRVQALNPPSRFRAAHNKMEEGMRLMVSAGDDIAMGVDHLDAGRIDQANSKINRAATLFGEATELIGK